jgi:hypothetical protein
MRNINGGSFTPVPGESAVVNLSLDVAGGPLTFTLLRGNPAVRSISGVLAVVPGFDDSGPGNDAPM